MTAGFNKNVHSEYNLILQPFPIRFDYYDRHVMLFFENHPEYESIEAMIKEDENGKTNIRAIITLRDQTQVDHISSPSALKIANAGTENGRTYYTPIRYKFRRKFGKANILLEFKSYKGEDIYFDFRASSKVKSGYCGLVDPGGHSGNTSLPVMYRERSTLAGRKSRIMINGKEYHIPVELKIPLLFTGMKGYYSEAFYMGAIRNSTQFLGITRIPVTLKAREGWEYETGTGKIVFEIEKANGSLYIIGNKSVTVTAWKKDRTLEIEKIDVLSPRQENEIIIFSLEFDPAIPAVPVAGNVPEKQSNFKIHIGGHKNLVTGRFNVVNRNGRTEIVLTPLNPSWALNRSVVTVIAKQTDRFRINTSIGLNTSHIPPYQ